MEEEVRYVRTVICPGTWDGVHKGHEELIEIAFDISDNVLVLINSDKMIEERKGIKLLTTEEERLSRIKSLYPNCTARVVESLEEIKFTMRSLAKLGLHPLVLHGDDYDTKSISTLYNVETRWWRVNGLTLLFCHRSTGMSSTKLREAQGKHL